MKIDNLTYDFNKMITIYNCVSEHCLHLISICENFKIDRFHCDLFLNDFGDTEITVYSNSLINKQFSVRIIIETFCENVLKIYCNGVYSENLSIDDFSIITVCDAINDYIDTCLCEYLKKQKLNY